MGTRRATLELMPEIGPGPALERFTLVAQGDVYCIVDIVDHDSASILLTALPGLSAGRRR